MLCCVEDNTFCKQWRNIPLHNRSLTETWSRLLFVLCMIVKRETEMSSSALREQCFEHLVVVLTLLYAEQSPGNCL